MSNIMGTIPRITTPKPTHGQAPSHSPPDVRYVPGNSLARFLGWFSIGLGAAEVLCPDALSRLTGVRQKSLLPFYGAREIACGIGILHGSRPTEWLWARVLGDALDLATLGVDLMTGDGEQKERAAISTLAVVGVTALDLLCSVQHSAAAALTDD